MKKTLLIIFICAAAVSAAAQGGKTYILGVRGGFNATSLSYSGIDKSVNRSAKFGWHLGVSDQILLSRIVPLYLETGLYLSNKGGKWRESATEGDVTTTEFHKFGMTYMQVPLRLNWHFEVDDDVSIEPFIGIHYALGLWGRAVTEIGGNREVSRLFNGRDFRRSDVGVSLGLGTSWYDFYAAFGWERGFLNLSKVSGISATNTGNFMITVGYNF